VPSFPTKVLVISCNNMSVIVKEKFSVPNKGTPLHKTDNIKIVCNSMRLLL